MIPISGKLSHCATLVTYVRLSCHFEWQAITECSLLAAPLFVSALFTSLTLKGVSWVCTKRGGRLMQMWPVEGMQLFIFVFEFRAVLINHLLEINFWLGGAQRLMCPVSAFTFYVCCLNAESPWSSDKTWQSNSCCAKDVLTCSSPSILWASKAFAEYDKKTTLLLSL